MAKKLTTYRIANMLGMSDQSVSNWIDSGQLLAERTPGGHRRVEREDLIAFLKDKKMRIPPELSPAPPTVLIVDDERTVTRWLTKVLSQKLPECRILAANDGFAVGRIVTTDRPDVILLDLFMPGMDGFEVCRRIKSDPQTLATKVVAITAHPSAESEKAICSAGAEMLVPKPLDATEIAALVGSLLGRRT